MQLEAGPPGAGILTTLLMRGGDEIHNVSFAISLQFC